MGGATRRTGHRVADPRLTYVLHTGDQIADLADAETLARDRLRADDADLEQLVGRAGRDHQDPLARVEVAVDDSDVRHHAAVGVIDRVEDHRPGGSARVSDGRRQRRDDLVEQGLDALAGLAGHAQALLRGAADEVRELGGVLVRLRRRQVDLVEHRDDVQVVLEREIEVGQGLRLDALGGVDEEDGALASSERAADLVGEVDVPRGVDHVEDVGLAVHALPRETYGLALDRDAALALDVHPVEVLRARVARLDDSCDAQHAVGERRLAVVDVSDDAEVAQEFGGGRPRSG